MAGKVDTSRAAAPLTGAFARKKMIKQDKSKFEPAWEILVLGAAFVVMGIVMVVQGYGAYRSGEIIPLTGKHGPMTGLEFMIAGAMFSLFGLGFVSNELVKARQKQK